MLLYHSCNIRNTLWRILSDSLRHRTAVHIAKKINPVVTRCMWSDAQSGSAIAGDGESRITSTDTSQGRSDEIFFKETVELCGTTEHGVDCKPREACRRREEKRKRRMISTQSQSKRYFWFKRGTQNSLRSLPNTILRFIHSLKSCGLVSKGTRRRVEDLWHPVA
jgi:hypothetical protein